MALFVDRRPVARYERGILLAFASAFIALVLLLANTRFKKPKSTNGKPVEALVSIQGGLLAVVLASSFGIQRRPHVFVGERLVDGQFTTSVWGKFTYTWPWPTLRFAKKNKGLKLEDVPLLPNNLRSPTLLKVFHATRVFKRLWMRVLWFFRWTLLMTTALISLTALLQFGPQLAMLQILTLLEQKTPGERVPVEAYYWVLGLGLAMIASAFVETWLFWVTEARLGVPSRGLLSGLIFEKATRRKNAQGGHKKKLETGASDRGEGENIVLNEGAGREEHPQTQPQAATHPRDTVVAGGEDEKEKKEEDDDEAEAKKTRQGVINLIAVDTQRFQFFITYFYLYPNVAVKLIVSITFLVNVVGWIPLLSGFAAFACTIPFNIFWSRKYVGRSNDLMKYRDQKLASVTEALQGIKQIKYSAIEQQWQDRIAEKRSKELKTQRAAFMYDIGLIACWISGKPGKREREFFC